MDGFTDQHAHAIRALLDVSPRAQQLDYIDRIANSNHSSPSTLSPTKDPVLTQDISILDPDTEIDLDDILPSKSFSTQVTPKGEEYSTSEYLADITLVPVWVETEF